MKAEEPQPFEGREERACPKRLWVMLTLSDDEALESDGALPQGLRFHLSRCPSCRGLADRLQSITDSLCSMSDVEPDGDLQGRADAQAKQALAEGARITGRVTIPEESERLPVAVRGHRWSTWLRYSGLAAAAAILVGFGLYWSAVLASRDGGQLANTVNSPNEQRRITPQTARPEDAEPGDAAEGGDAADERASGEPDERLADGRGDGGIDPVLPRQRRPRMRVCRHYSHVEAAQCENPTCIHRATVLPDVRQRDLGWGQALFDMPRHTMSTGQGDGGE